MQIVSILFRKVLPIFLLMLAGLFYSRVQKGIDTKQLNKFNMTLPFSAYMFHSTYKMQLVLNDVFEMAMSIACLLVASYIVLYLALRAMKRTRQRGFYFSTLFMNVSFLLPILLLQYGDQGLAKGLNFVFLAVILFFSLGIFLVNLDIDKFRSGGGATLSLAAMVLTPFKNPIIWAALAGASLNILRVPVTDIVLIPVKLAGDIMIPLATILIGYSLATIRVKEFRAGCLAFGMRLVSGLVLGLLIVSLFRITGLTAKVIVLMASLPTAVFAMPMADNHNADPDIVSSSLVIGTFASILTLPLVITLVDYLY